jgi:hypothetical protein
MRKKQTAIVAAVILTIFNVGVPAAFADFSERDVFCGLARLIGKQPGSQITLRSGAGTNYPSQGYGLVGDRVAVLYLDKRHNNIDHQLFYDSGGHVWYKVGFPKSRAVGWIRGDFVDVSSVCTGE